MKIILVLAAAVLLTVAATSLTHLPTTTPGRHCLPHTHCQPWK